MTRHICGIWNGMWSDQPIESTFMRFGPSTGGIIRLQYHANLFRLVTLKSMISMPSTHGSLLSSDPDVDVTDVFSFDPMSLHLSQPRCS